MVGKVAEYLLCPCLNSRLRMVWFRSLQTPRHMPMNVSSSGPFNKANIFLGLIEYQLNSLLGASHLVDHISVHIRFDLERYLLNMCLFN